MVTDLPVVGLQLGARGWTERIQLEPAGAGNCHGGKATSRFRLHVERRKALLRIERSKEDAQSYEPYASINDEDADISVICRSGLLIPHMAYGFLETGLSVNTSSQIWLVGSKSPMHWWRAAKCPTSRFADK